MYIYYHRHLYNGPFNTELSHFVIHENHNAPYCHINNFFNYLIFNSLNFMAFDLNICTANLNKQKIGDLNMYAIKLRTEPTLSRFENCESKLKTNIITNENEMILNLLVPGFDKNEISISTKGDLLIIEGKASNEDEEKFNYIRKEFLKRDFKNEFSISTKYNMEQIKATIENGILQLHIPLNQGLNQSKKINIH